MSSDDDKQHTLVETKTGEYIPAQPASPPPRRTRLLSPLIWGLVSIGTVFFILFFGRQWYDSLLVRMDQHKPVHVDSTFANTGVTSQVSPQITLVYQNKSGKMTRVIADAQQYSAFVHHHTRQLEDARERLLLQTRGQLDQTLSPLFAEMQQRVERFADWYFAYSTTYKILWKATTSAAQHAVSVEAVSLSDAVAYDVEQYLLKQYENIVLRPEVTDPKLVTAYQTTFKSAHRHYVETLSMLQADFLVFVARQTTHLETTETNQTALTIDWRSQLNKVNMADYEKGPQGAAVGATLAVGGAILGKGVAAKAATSAASKGIFAKLASPFVSKAVLVGAGGAVGTLGGPVGTAVGAIGGLGIDYAINEGLELTQRETFVADVQDALATTQMGWQKIMQQSLQAAINVWLNDTIQLLPRYE